MIHESTPKDTKEPFPSSHFVLLSGKVSRPLLMATWYKL